MKKNDVKVRIEKQFKKQFQKDKRLTNSYLMVHSEQYGLDIMIAEGSTQDKEANIKQPNYMASVGKLFTSTLIGILHEKGKLDFNDPISKFLDRSLMKNLHVYLGTDYSNEITIKHLLQQTSGLADNFWTLLDELMEDNDMSPSPRETVLWVKDNTKPHFPPGKGFKYSDTNYHLLGLIIESITSQPFHVALMKYIFIPLDMKHSYMLHYSSPIEETVHPTASFYYDQTRLNDIVGYARIDYSGGGVVATFDDLLKFMKALVTNKLLRPETLNIMKNDCAKFALGIDYGYGVWKIKTVPLIMPKQLNSWGVAGATGAFMFYHPEKDAYIIGNFNHTAYQTKGLQYMLLKVLKHLSKL